MASFEREKALVEHLLSRLGIGGAVIDDPNAAAGKETGVDVRVRLVDGRTVGVQATEIDPHVEPGTARRLEKAIAKANPGRPYFMWGQNDNSVVLDAITRSMKRKVEIAARHSFPGYDEVWLLLCAGIPERGSVVSTSIMTLWLSAEDLDLATDKLLQGSSYHRCFLHPILVAEQAFYSWTKPSRWEKRVKLDVIRDVPRAAYVDSLLKAAKAGDRQEVARLFDEECRQVLDEMRRNP